MADRINDLIVRGDHLFSKRQSLNSLWQDIAEHFYVERADFTAGRSPGTEFAGHLTSSYPLLVRRELGNAFSAMLRPRDQQWFAISVDREDKLDRAGREWLERASAIQRRAMYDRQAQFVRATKEGDNDFAAFGQCVIGLELDQDKKTLLYRCWHLRDVVWVEAYDGSTHETHRKWKPHAKELEKLFPGKVHKNITDRAKDDPFGEVDCRHVIIPSEDYDWPEGKRFPYASIYLDVENKHVLREIGSRSPIYTKPRWQTVSGSPYAYSPATVAGLPDARLIQAMTLTLLEAGEWSIRPPMLGRKDVIQGELALFAGGVTAVDRDYDERMGEALRPIVQDRSGVPFGVDLVRDTREQLANAFYLNKLTLPPPDHEMTAYEAGQRIQEYIRTALPLFEPMEMEYNGALCEDTFWTLFRDGAFGPETGIPQSIRGAEPRFRFESPLHEAIERRKGQKLLEGAELTRVAIELDPSALPTINARAALRDALTGIGTPATWLRDEEQVEQMATDAEEAQKLERATEQLAGAAQTGKLMGEAGQALDAAQ